MDVKNKRNNVLLQDDDDDDLWLNQLSPSLSSTFTLSNEISKYESEWAIDISAFKNESKKKVIQDSILLTIFLVVVYVLA